MRVYIEAREEGEGESLEFHQEEVSTNEEDALTVVNSGLNGAKTYKKRVHYCMHDHNQPCVVEEIINDTITTERRPNIEITTERLLNIGVR